MGSYHYDGHKWLRRIGSNSSIVIGGHDDVVNVLKKQQERIDTLVNASRAVVNALLTDERDCAIAELEDLLPAEPQAEGYIEVIEQSQVID